MNSPASSTTPGAAGRARPPPKATSSVRRPRNRRAAIVDAAAELFAAKGFASVGIDDIAAKVGVTGPAIYRHFPSKDALLDEVVLSTVTLLATSTAAPGASRRDLVAGAVAFALDHPARLATYLRERPRLGGPFDHAVAKLEAEIHHRWSARLHAELPDLDDQRVRVRQRAATGALSAAALRRNDVDPARTRDLLTASTLAMLTIPPVADPPLPLLPRRSTWEAPASRREQLLVAALDLFRQRGFRGVGIDEIGEAVGISGSAVYRHFDAKADILVDAYDRAGERVAAGVDEALERAGSPVEAVAGLTASYARVALDNVDLIVVTSREGAALPAEERPRFARRRRALRDRWAAVLRQARPELTEPEARLLVATTLGLVNSSAAAGRPGDRMTGEVSALALAYIMGT